MYAFPGKARKLMLLTYVAKIDIPTTHAESFPPAEVYSFEFLLLEKKEHPKIIVPIIKIRKTM